MTQTKAKIEKQASKLRSFIAEMECFAHEINKLSNQEILEIDLSKISELNVETANVILESIKSKNTNFCFKDFNPIEDCLLKKNEINLWDFIQTQRKQAQEAERISLCEKLNLVKKASLAENVFDNNAKNNNVNYDNRLSFRLKVSKSNGNLDNLNDNDYFNDNSFNAVKNESNLLKQTVISNNNNNKKNFEESLGLGNSCDFNNKSIYKENGHLVKSASINVTNGNSDNCLLNEHININNNNDSAAVNNYRINLTPQVKIMSDCMRNSDNLNNLNNENKNEIFLNSENNQNSNSFNLNNNNQNNNNLNYEINSESKTNTIINPIELRNSQSEFPTELTNDFANLGFNNNSFRIEESNNNPNQNNNNNNNDNNNSNNINNNLNTINNIINPNTNNLNNYNNNNFTSNHFLNNSFYRKNSFTNTEVINTTNINFIPYNPNNLSASRKKSDFADIKARKSSEKNYINNLNNHSSNIKYKIIKSESEDSNFHYQNFLSKTGFYDFSDLSDLILFIGDSKDKSILLFNKKNFFWKKLENAILGEYEFLDYCCLTKFGAESAYLITGGCIYSNYKNTAVNSTYLAKILNHKENFLVSFTPFKPMNKPRFSHGSCSIRGKAYVFGGHDGASTLSCIEAYDAESFSWKYVLETEDKSAQAEMNVEREIFASCAIDDRFIYIFGGFNDIHLDSIERFDVESGRWQLLQVKLSNPLQNSTACCLGKGEIAIIGGYNGSLQRGVEVLNYEKGFWVENQLDERKLVIPRRRAHCYKYDNKVVKLFLLLLKKIFFLLLSI